MPVPSAGTKIELTANGTDQTAALQQAIDAGGEILVPKGIYRVDGPIIVSAPVTIAGEPGTVLDCSKAAGDVFTINPKGMPAEPMKGVAITGIEIEGPGEGTAPVMIWAHSLDGLHVDHCRIRNVGYAGIMLVGCTDAVIEGSVFDTIYRDTDGYGIGVMAGCDRVTVRKNWFIGKGRHAVTITGYGTEKPETWARLVTVEDNYFADFWNAPIDSHYCFHGPYLARNNVFHNCDVGVQIRGDETGSTFEENVFADVNRAFYLTDQNRTAENPPTVTQTIRGNLHTVETAGATINGAGYFANVAIGTAVIDGNTSARLPGDPFVVSTGAKAIVTNNTDLAV